jgi:hypothetical protein
MEELVKDSVAVMLDKERHLQYSCRSYRALIAKYGTTLIAIDALQKITPHKDEEGKSVAIEQDNNFFATLVAWLHAGLVSEEKDLTIEAVSDEIDTLSLLDSIRLRSSIWEAFFMSLPKPKIDADPTNPTS